jgi:hypothetical protein
MPDRELDLTPGMEDDFDNDWLNNDCRITRA